MNCYFEGCENEATFRYVWAWGEDGHCCDEHRAQLETQSAQLARGIVFVAASEPKTDPGRNVRTLPDPELSRLEVETAELRAQVQALAETKVALEGELAIARAELDALRTTHGGGTTASQGSGESPREGQSPDPSSTPR